LSSQNQSKLAAVTAKGDQMMRYVKQNSSPPYWEQEKDYRKLLSKKYKCTTAESHLEH
jgi:hypothetical protein